MAAACGPACRLSTTPARRCPLHCPPTPALVILGLSSRGAVLGPLQSPNQPPISRLLPPPPHRPPHRPPLPHCPPTRPWPSRSFPGWKSVGRRPSRKTVHPATTLATVCYITPVSVFLPVFALISPTHRTTATTRLSRIITPQHQSVSLSLTIPSLSSFCSPSISILLHFHFLTSVSVLFIPPSPSYHHILTSLINFLFQTWIPKGVYKVSQSILPNRFPRAVV